MSVAALTKRQRIFERDGHACRYCATRVAPGQPRKRVKSNTATIDHMLPRSKGGSNDETNLATACFSCNAQKKDRTADEFISWRLERCDSEETRL